MSNQTNVNTKKSINRMSVSEAKEAGWRPKAGKSTKQSAAMDGLSKAQIKLDNTISTIASSKMNIHHDENYLMLTTSVLPPSMNTVVGLHGTSWFKLKKAWQYRIQLAIMEARLSDLKITHAWTVTELRTPYQLRDNDGTCIKHMIDAFVLAGIYKDDSHAFFPVSPFHTQVKSSNEDVLFKIIFFKRHSEYVSYIQSYCSNTYKNMIAEPTDSQESV